MVLFPLGGRFCISVMFLGASIVQRISMPEPKQTMLETWMLGAEDELLLWQVNRIQIAS